MHFWHNCMLPCSFIFMNTGSYALLVSPCQLMRWFGFSKLRQIVLLAQSFSFVNSRTSCNSVRSLFPVAFVSISGLMSIIYLLYIIHQMRVSKALI